MKWCLLLVPFLFCGCQNKKNSLHLFSNRPHTKIYIQPFEHFPSSYSLLLLSELEKFCSDITLLKPASLPQEAWYEPRQRYRADKLIHWLKTRVHNKEAVIGLTLKDISTTKNEIKDFGVMGLGFTPGKSCVVSTFRLNKQNVKQQLFKVANHELGHTQGLKHCPVKTCFMRDAEGGNPTNEEKGFCKKCKKHLQKKGWKFQDV